MSLGIALGVFVAKVASSHEPLVLIPVENEMLLEKVPRMELTVTVTVRPAVLGLSHARNL
jgi:Na+-transporting methylmalonyl-CoA/oxaloacetate decarboxylase beta subunit